MDNKFFVFVKDNWDKINEFFVDFAGFIKKIYEEISGLINAE